MVPYEAFLSGKPVLTTTDAGGPLEVVSDRETGLRRRARPRRSSRGPARTSPRTPTRRRRSGPPGGSSPSGSPGTPASPRSSHEGRLLLAAAAVAVRDRRLLGAAPAGAARAGRRGRSPQPGKRAPDADVALYHVGNDPDAHGWIVDALARAARRRRPARVRPPPPDRRHHDRARRRPRLPRRDGARARRRRAAARPRRARQPAAAALGDAARAVPARRHGARPGDRARSSTRATSSGSAREAGYAGRLWRIPHPAWPTPHVEPAADVVGRAADRLLRVPEHEQAHPAAARGVRARCAASVPARGCCSSARRASASTSQRRLERLGLDRGRRRGSTTSPRSGCGR